MKAGTREVSRTVVVVALCVLLALSTGCGKLAQRLAARKELKRQNIALTDEAFAVYVTQGDVDTVRLFLDAGMDPNRREHPTGLTPLARAAENGHLEVTRVLLEKGANPNLEVWERPLYMAAKEGHEDIVRLLLQKGAEINGQNIGFSETALYSAAKEGRTEIVRFLIENGADVNLECEFGATPLTAAASAGQTEIVRMVLEKNPDVNARDGGKWGMGPSALEYAAWGDHVEIIRMLLEKEPNIDKERFEWAWRHAACDGQLETVRTFFDYAPKLAANDVLEVAAWAYRREIVELAIKYGADGKSKDSLGFTGFMKVVRAGYVEFLPILLERGADINSKAGNGLTALHFAAWTGDINIAKYLIENGADVNVLDNTGITPLAGAKFRGHAEVAKFLRDAGATAGDQLIRDDITKKLMSTVQRANLSQFYANWDDDIEYDGAEISVSLWTDAGNLDFDGIELPLRVKIYAIFRDRLIYEKTHVVDDPRKRIRIPFEDIGPLLPEEKRRAELEQLSGYGFIDLSVTLPDGRYFEEKSQDIKAEKGFVYPPINNRYSEKIENTFPVIRVD